VLSAENIVVRRGGRSILDLVSVAVRPGRVMALLGPNGAGKSTLLHVLAGDLRPDRGHATLDGRPLALYGARALAQRRAVLTQQTHLDFPFTAEQVALIGATPRAQGWHERDADRALTLRALAAVDIADKAAQLYPTLSGGEKQRVHMARVLVQLNGDDDATVPAAADAPGTSEGDEARYLLLDEPTASLDAAHAHMVLKIARREARRGAGVLVVLHDIQLACLYADDAAVLSEGRLAAAGRVQDVLTPGFVERIFGVPAITVTPPGGDRPIIIFTAPEG